MPLQEALLEIPAAVSLLKKMGLVDEAGAWRTTDIAMDGLGPGPILDPAVVEKFATLETTRDYSTLHWMLLMAGGGTTKMAESVAWLEANKASWIKERTEGIGDNGQPAAPLTPEQAEKAWAEVEPGFKAAIYPADQDTLAYAHDRVFGYYRFWPGKNGIYEDVYDQVKVFLEHVTGREGRQSHASFINRARQQRAAAADSTSKIPRFTPVATELSAYSSLEELRKVNNEFRSHFQKKKEQKNIQFIGRHPEQGYTKGADHKFYEDDNIVAYLPATAAAMMKVGWKAWCVANKTEFEDAFRLTNPKEPRWTEYGREGPLLVILMKKDLVEPDRPEGHPWHKSIQQLAVYLKPDEADFAEMGEPYPGVQFFDRENRNYPTKVDWGELITRLKAMNEPGLTDSVRAVMQEFVKWARQMKPGDIKLSVYERMASLLVWNMLYS